jgi:hypothetical protein
MFRFGCLVVHAGRTLGPIILGNSTSDPSDALSLGTTTCTKALSALTSQQGEFTSPMMLSLMKSFFLSLSYTKMPEFDFVPSCSSLNHAISLGVA